MEEKLQKKLAERRRLADKASEKASIAQENTLKTGSSESSPHPVMPSQMGSQSQAGASVAPLREQSPAKPLGSSLPLPHRAPTSASAQHTAQIKQPNSPNSPRSTDKGVALPAPKPTLPASTEAFQKSDPSFLMQELTTSFEKNGGSIQPIQPAQHVLEQKAPPTLRVSQQPVPSHISPPLERKLQAIPNDRYTAQARLDAVLQNKPLSPDEEKATAAAIKESLISISIPKALIRFDKKIGKGAFGVVYKGEYKGIPVAIKEVAPHKTKGGLERLSPLEILQAFEWEVSRLSMLSHTNLVHFYGVCQNEEGNLCLVMEYCPKGTLKECFENARKPPQAIPSQAIPAVAAAEKSPEKGAYDIVDPLEEDKGANLGSYDAVEENELYAQSSEGYDLVLGVEEENKDNPEAPNPLPSQQIKPSPSQAVPVLPLSEVWRFALEMAYGLFYLHQKGTVHRDLKSENVLLDEDGHIKLADLGVAQVDSLISSQEAKVVAQGMKDGRYAAPEEFKGQSTAACDMYSYGLVLWEMLAGKTVLESHREWRKDGKPEDIPEYCPPELRTLLEGCWAPDPKDRPTAKEVIRELEEIAPKYISQSARVCLAQQTLEILDEQRSALVEYIPSDIAGSEENISIQTQLQHFIQSKTPVCVIVGVGGLGKSLAGYVLSHELLRDSGPKAPLPILIRPAIVPWTHTELNNGIQKALTHYRLTSQGIAELKKIPVLFIVDGYDELSGEQQGNLPRQLGLDAWPNAKLLVSVRPDAVPQNKRQGVFAHQNQLIEYTLKPFDLAKVTEYLTRSLSHQEVALLQGTMVRAPTLEQTLTNPFVLSIFLKTWDSQKEHDLAQLTQAKIYQIAIQHWIYTQDHHLPPFVQRLLSGAHSNSSPAVDLKSLLLHSAQRWLYQTAFAMAKGNTLVLTPIANHPWNQLTQIINQYAEDAIQARDCQIATLPEKEAALAKKRVLLTVEDYRQFLQSKIQQFFALSPLEESNGQQQFIHKTLFEYCAAIGIVEVLSIPISTLSKEKPAIAPSKKEKTEGTSPSCIPSHDEIRSKASYLRKLGLHPGFILWDAGVLSFLQSIATPQDLINWEAWIEASKQDKAASLPAACAITALNGLNKILAYRRWAGIQIPEADLRGARLEYSDLTGADLSQVRLEAATLYHTCLQQATLTGIQFGQRPMLQFEDEVNCIAFHPRGTLLAVGLNNGQIVLQDSETRRITTILKGHKWGVLSIAFLSEGSLLASGSRDHTVRLWSVDTGTTHATFEVDFSHIGSVAFSPDGRCFALSIWDHTVRLLSLDSGTVRAILNGHTEAVITSLAFSPDGYWLAVGNSHIYAGTYNNRKSNTVRLWDVKNGTIRVTLNGHTDAVTSVAFSPDGSLLASGSRDHTVRLWSVDTGTTRTTFEGHTNSITSVAFSPDGSLLASGSEDTSMRLWSVNTGSVRAILNGHTQWITNVSFSPDGLCVASCSRDQTISRWTVDAEAARATLAGHENTVTSVAFSSDRGLLASGSEDDTVRLWSVDSGTVFATLKGHARSVNSVAFSPNGQCLASVSYDTVRLWSVDSGTVKEHAMSVNSVAFSPDGQCLASGSRDKVLLWAVDTGVTRAILEGHGNSVTSVAFSPDGSLLASGSIDKTVRLWAVDTETIHSILEGHTQQVTSVAFSPNRLCLASASYDKTVYLWVVDNGTVRATLKGHTQKVTSVAFSPDELCLASASHDKTVRLWDLRMNACIDTLHFAQSVQSVTYATTGQLGIAVKNEVQCWMQAGNQALLSSKQPRFSLMWRTCASTALDATECNIEGVNGLSQQNINLLEQLGSKGKPASTTAVGFSPTSTRFFPSPAAIPAPSTAVSVSTLKSVHALQSPPGILSTTESADIRTHVTGSPTHDFPPAARKSPITSQGFFSQTQFGSANSSSLPVSTTTQTTTATTMVTSTSTRQPQVGNASQPSQTKKCTLS